MKILFNSLIIIFFAFKALSNENISKLNSLYLNGVLDKETYFNSLEGLGIDTSNQIFTNLFDLFSDRTLDITSYEKSISNLISMTGKKKSTVEAIIPQNSQTNNLPIVKTYKLVNCKGDSGMCGLFEDIQFPFTLKDNDVVVDKETIQSLVDSDQDLQRIMTDQNFSKNDAFDHIITIRHIRGFLISLKFGGYLEGNDFFLTNCALRANGTEIISSELELIQG